VVDGFWNWFLVLLFLASDEVRGHGRLMDPPNRSSIWRFKEFASHNPPTNYNDNEVTHYD